MKTAQTKSEWVLAAMAVLLAFATLRPAPAKADVITSNPLLPPQGGHYVSQFHTSYDTPGGLLSLENIIHKGFRNIIRTPENGHEVETFDSTLFATLFTTAIVMGGMDTLSFPVQLNGPVSVKTFDKIGNVTGTFDTELLSMSLTGTVGGVPIIIRESPSLLSIGEVTITELGGGLFRMSSFFDVFTELSLDGGQSWIPQDPQRGPTRVNLVPEPTALALVAIGILGLVGRRLLRRSGFA